ncbi:hypothetical protein ZEAMMB73_Zm00001d012570 [Zea mays]|uniref:Uncharacterized protein n=1 Tax=Zea mays TaxID=4577 RepID=A0A1D6G9V2_MAIZE|nr:hypothetical protein ZEAMMB73_Zm00001d012570 [Zea mays]
MFMRCFLLHIAMRIDYSLILHYCNLVVITTVGLMTFIDHLENLAPLKTYIAKGLLHSVREPRGFGFIQYFDPEDASDAKYHMDGKMLLGREIVVVLQRKT